MATEKSRFGVYRMISNLHTSFTLGKTSASLLEVRNKNVLKEIQLFKESFLVEIQVTGRKTFYLQSEC